MKKLLTYLLPGLSLLAIAVLFYLSYLVALEKYPDKAPGFAAGISIGNLLMPLIFSFIAGFIKRSFSENKKYDWRMFHLFLISFCFLSIIGKYAELYGEEKEKTEEHSSQIKPRDEYCHLRG